MVANSTMCAFCGSPLVDYSNSQYFKKCKGCGLVVRVKESTSGSLDNLYEMSWSNPEDNTKVTGMTDVALGKQYAKHLLNEFGLQNFKGMRLLDFGAGKGKFADVFIELGAEVHLYEPFGYEYLLNRGYRAYREISAIDPDLLFDGFVSLNVIEHLEKPWEDLSKFIPKVRQGGWFFIVTANTKSLNSLITRDKWRELQNPSHLLMMNFRNMKLILEKAGLVECRRMRWPIKFDRSLLRQLLIYCLQFLGIDGELKFLGMAPSVASLNQLPSSPIHGD